MSNERPRGPADSSLTPAWARALGRLLDGAITIPGTNFRIGLDPILGLLLPEVGDALSGVLSLTLLAVAWRERVPRVVIGRMLVNLLLDTLLGAVPLVGDLFDFGFRANERNLALIERHRGGASGRATFGDYVVVIAAALVTLLLIALPLVLGVALIRWLAGALG